MELKLKANWAKVLRAEVLIVPYGIETVCGGQDVRCHCVLIVPYGIETLEVVHLITIPLRFNRTLWN